MKELDEAGMSCVMLFLRCFLTFSLKSHFFRLFCFFKVVFVGKFWLDCGHSLLNLFVLKATVFGPLFEPSFSAGNVFLELLQRSNQQIFGVASHFGTKCFRCPALPLVLYMRVKRSDQSKVCAFHFGYFLQYKLAFCHEIRCFKIYSCALALLGNLISWPIFQDALLPAT